MSANTGMDKAVVYMYVCMYVCIYICIYYSAMKKNEIMLFVATWMDLDILILSQTKTNTITLIYEI